MDCLILVDMGLKQVTQAQYGPSVPFGGRDEDESSLNFGGQEERRIKMLDCLEPGVDQRPHCTLVYDCEIKFNTHDRLST